jgi:hypothetical protein
MILSLEERESSFSLLPLASQLKLTRFDRLLCSSSALSIAYESDVTKLRPNSFTVISVNYASVWKRETDYQIPAELPACPPGGCHCSWNWIHTSMNTNAQGRLRIGDGTSSPPLSIPHGLEQANICPTSFFPSALALSLQYHLLFKCNVTGSPYTTDQVQVAPGQISTLCEDDKANCTIGAKHPHLYVPASSRPVRWE